MTRDVGQQIVERRTGLAKLPLLLTTKILPPRIPAELIDRPRLVALLPLVRNKRLVVMKAPAGFGKTSVAVTWAEGLRGTDSKVAWVGLDQDDDVPTRLLYHAAHALRRTCGLGSAMIEMITDIPLLPIQTVISALINELAELDEDIYIFLDDYHHITEPTMHDGMSFFLRHASSNVHVVLTTRTDPPLPLMRLRVQSELLEIDASMLRFDLAETRRFLEQEHVGDLNASDLKRLHATTCGWPVALRLIASACEGDLTPCLRSIRDVARPIGAYIEDMLATLPPDMVAFMERTSILDRFNTSVCDAVTDTTSGRQLLQSIMHRQLLLTPLDQDALWYRYHPLLAEFLRQRLETQYPTEVPVLHRRAAQWFAANEFWTHAVGHAIAAGDARLALSLIENCAMAVVKRGDLLTLLEWQRHFPHDLMRGQLRVRLAIAWGMALAMRFDEALTLLADIEHDLPGENAIAGAEIANECRTIRSVAVALKDDSATALSLAEPCLNRQTADPWNTNVASNVVRFAYWKAGNLEAFYATPWVPYAPEDDQRNLLSHIYRRCLQGLVELEQLRFGVAERKFQDAMQQGIQLSGPQSTVASLPASLIARIHYEQGRLDEAEAMIADRLAMINATAMLECVLTTHVVLSRIAASRSNIERAYALLEQGANLGYARHWGRLTAAMEVERLRLYVSEGRVTEASACVIVLERLVSKYPVSTRCAWSEIEQYLCLARAHVALAKGSPKDAFALLHLLREGALGAHNHYFALRLETLLAVALLDAGESIKAVEVFHHVVSVAAPAGIFRTILDCGPQIGLLVPRLRENVKGNTESGHLPAYLDHLLEGWHALRRPEPAQGQRRTIADALSPREHEILRLIAQGQSNKEIARSLRIAPETVKSHVKNIFAKLAVEKRVQAVSRAQSLGLVRTP